ncbi:hypothetical protein ABT369_18115 [Dactylosporangium sp. NPDC000244]|uniref:hypothetical protein n=1 Tax=Dactylosporangium sp. NPDC000244 TaxID=3154365 RepID=UPI0033241942
MSDTDVARFVLVRSRWQAAVPLGVTVVFRALIVAYALALGARGLMLFAVLALFGVTGALGLFAFVATLTVPPAEVTADGLRLRALAVSTGLTDLAWSEVRAAWIAYLGSQRCLFALAGERERPYFSPIPDGPGAADAVRELSGGTVTVANEPPPRPQTDSPGFRLAGVGRARRTPLLVAVLPWVLILVMLPWLTHTTPAWDQPWWPGNH